MRIRPSHSKAPRGNPNAAQTAQRSFRRQLSSLLPPGLSSALVVVILCGVAVAQQTDPRQIFDEALAAQKSGNAALAVRDYQRVLRLQPGLTAARANLAGALVSLGKYDEAIAEYKTALKEVPGNSALELNLAIAYFKKGDAASAAGLLSALHAVDPADEKVAILLGGCDLRLGQDPLAAELLTPFEARDPDNPDLEFALGSALIGDGRAREGLSRVEKAARVGQRPEAYLLAAQTNLKLEQFEQARQDVQAAMRLDPSLPGLDAVDGRVLDYFGDQKGAIAAYEKAIKANPNDFEAQLQLGAVLYSQRKLEGARRHLGRALAMQPASAPAHYELGRVDRAAGNLIDAAKELEAAEQEDPNWLEPHVELTALYYRLKRPNDGAREKAVVDRLKAEQQQRGTRSRIITPGAP